MEEYSLFQIRKKEFNVGTVLSTNKSFKPIRSSLLMRHLKHSFTQGVGETGKTDMFFLFL